MIQRNQLIDFIRGFSILAVVLHHCFVHLPVDKSLMHRGELKILLQSGYYGVIIFFVVSGFLITSMSLKRGGNVALIKLAPFYTLRFARIAPCLFAVLALSSLFHWLTIKGFVITRTSLAQALFSALTFQINWLREKTGYLPANWDVLWSLSIEEMFYLFFPLLCIIVRKQNYLTLVMLTFIALGPLNRTIFSAHELWGDYAYLSCMDGIAIGCLAALFANQPCFKKNSISLFMAGLLLFSFIFFFRKQVFNLGITSFNLNVTLLEISIAFILMANQHIKVSENVRRVMRFRSVEWFGRNSYEIYLTHSFIVMFASHVLYNTHASAWLRAVEYFMIVLASGLLGQVISTYYSEPLNNYFRTRYCKEVFILKKSETISRVDSP